MGGEYGAFRRDYPSHQSMGGLPGNHHQNPPIGGMGTWTGPNQQMGMVSSTQRPQVSVLCDVCTYLYSKHSH